ncbi:MAG: hypothetical protein C0485_13840 [Pirellula sp.]|nr:hypothetical protein [Pirellula sp.]
MAIHLDSESLLTLQAAARWLPGRPHISTLHRWRMRGVRGVKLETCLIGGTRYTSKEALQDFVDAIDVHESPIIASQTCVPLNKVDGNVRKRVCSSPHAKSVLDAAGI